METGDLIELTDEDYRYIKNVLRLRPGEAIALFGYRGHEYQALIHEIAGGKVLVKIAGVQTLPESNIQITLAQALPKGDKMDFIVQKATELGVNGIIPFHSSRSIPKLLESKALERVKRWRKIALEAARQSGRGDIPEIEEITTYPELLKRTDRKGLNLIFWEAESGCGIKQILRNEQNAEPNNFFIAVGPEGGFSGEEVQAAITAGMTSVSLGKQVLKVETASLAILAIIQYERGLMGITADKDI